MKMDFCPNCFADTHEDICPYCGFNISQLEYTYVELKPGTVISNRYKIGRVLGIGGFGITYIGYDLQQNKRYAVKEYMPKDVAVRQESGRVEPNSNSAKPIYAKGLDMFLYETNILITLSGNRGIVEAENFVLENNTGYLIMEYLDGVSSKKLLNNAGALDYEMALNILIEVALALAAVHQKGLLHRDISPENIMVMKDGTVKLIDFGASRFFVGERSKSLSLILKHGFAPPEQYSSGGNQGEWTDIYALAATYYKLVTGMTIPDALTRSSNDTVQRLDKIEPQVKPYIAKAIQKALSLRPKDRYQNVHDFIKALKFDDEIPEVVPKETSVEITEPPKPVSGGFWRRLFSRPKPAAPRDVYNNMGQGANSYAGDYNIQNSYAQNGYNEYESTQNDYAQGSYEQNYYESNVYAPPAVSPYVRIVNGPYTIGHWVLGEDQDVFVGRDSSMCNIQVLDSSISRRHCSIRYNSQYGNFSVRDFSANGCFFANGVRLQNAVEYTLNKGDCIMLASQDYILEVGTQ